MKVIDARFVVENDVDSPWLLSAIVTNLENVLGAVELESDGFGRLAAGDTPFIGVIGAEGNIFAALQTGEVAR